MRSSSEYLGERVANLRAEAATWRAIAHRLSLRTDRERALAQASRCEAEAEQLMAREWRERP